MCKVLRIWPTKKNSRVYQGLLEVDADTFCSVIKEGRLFISYDVGSVYDAIELKFCFKCSGFNHFQKSCVSNKIACPKCSWCSWYQGLSSGLRSNCMNAKLPDVRHFAWDGVKCSVYKKKIAHVNQILFSVYMQNSHVLVVTVYHCPNQSHAVFIEKFDEWLNVHFSNFQGMISI